ncbi:MAG: DUF502 domain-containing protein [Nitrospirota bacterium]
MGDGFKKSVKKKLLTGLFITFPLVLSIIAIIWLFNLLDGILGGILERILGHHYPGLGILSSVFGIYLVGLLATTVFGRHFIEQVEAIVRRIPIFKSVYSTFKQLGNAFSPENRSSFKKFVIVEYPRKGAHSFGFLTKECILRSDSGVDECYNAVYIPTNNLYLGEVVLFRKDDIIYTDLSIEDGIKVMLSAGTAAPNVILRNERNHIEELTRPVSIAGGAEK